MLFKDGFKNVSHSECLFQENKPGAPGAYIMAGPENFTCHKTSFYQTYLGNCVKFQIRWYTAVGKIPGVSRLF